MALAIAGVLRRQWITRAILVERSSCHGGCDVHDHGARSQLSEHQPSDTTVVVIVIVIVIVMVTIFI